VWLTDSNGSIVFDDVNDPHAVTLTESGLVVTTDIVVNGALAAQNLVVAGVDVLSTLDILIQVSHSFVCAKSAVSCELATFQDVL
jgi:hypothetical protein